ncbi:the ARF-like 2 binding protein BART-domain-containing protein [Dunaliella salina]|uniref:ADP-ribosylation factor-like protein 2-binding protein n=1 Tax=Dunaliella salina TaxID=3046 RepID=A0ABQ7G7L0_DUNSA|nr:the ARF-like 2 binding protein BART-domain-containing protein [Dunaliella salina]|eukprot:KAF5830594.1 the ARF-like 2 binding protein BART-domain-containing protein [Dunaliella salina]
MVNFQVCPELRITEEDLQAMEAEQQRGCQEELLYGDGDYLDGPEEEIEFVNDGSQQDAETNHFDRIVGALTDILVDPEFEAAKDDFCQRYCIHFEDSGENKLEYMDIFTKYTELLEAIIDTRLRQAVPGFDMQDFLRMIDSRRQELMSDVFDLLLSLGDFETFKDMMLSFKQEQSGGGLGFEVQVRALRVHNEEEEGGDARPDLDGQGLCISPISRRVKPVVV